MPNQEEIAEESAANVNEQTIVDRIVTAVMEQRLPPGTKLSEAALCETFGVRRMRIRRALLLLASQDIVVLESNRGAFIARPSLQEARDVFEARKAIEPDVVRLAIERADSEDLAELSEYLRLERTARDDNARRDAIRLSGEFHVRLAAITGNAVLTRMTKALVARSSLIIGLFGASGASSCPDDEHDRILRALQKKDTTQAIALVRDHLCHIEAALDLGAGTDGQIDIRAVLEA